MPFAVTRLRRAECDSRDRLTLAIRRRHAWSMMQGDLSLLNHAVYEYTECLSADAAYPGALNNLGNALKEQVLPDSSPHRRVEWKGGGSSSRFCLLLLSSGSSAPTRSAASRRPSFESTAHARDRDFCGRMRVVLRWASLLISVQVRPSMLAQNFNSQFELCSGCVLPFARKRRRVCPPSVGTSPYVSCLWMCTPKRLPTP